MLAKVRIICKKIAYFAAKLAESAEKTPRIGQK